MQICLYLASERKKEFGNVITYCAWQMDKSYVDAMQTNTQTHGTGLYRDEANK